MSKKVFIKWEHGDANFETEKPYNFKTIEELKQFLNFIYDFRRFVKNSGYQNIGHFSDGHYESLPEWLNKIDAKHGNKFRDYVEMDKKYGQGDYAARIEHIWAEIDGVKHYIVWTKPLSFKKIKLPNIGQVLNLTTGGINGYGVEVFGGKTKDYIRDSDFKDLGKHTGDGTRESNYPKIKGKVLDCKPHWYKEYNADYTNLTYTILCENERGKFTIERYGFDCEYEKKYGRPIYQNIKIIEV